MPLEYPELRLAVLDGLESTYTLTDNSFYQNIWGNAGSDTITGNSFDNVLNGDTGADSMVGGSGSDTYVVDDAGDVVVERANGGNDLVRTTVNGYVLPVHVENLSLRGDGNIDGNGNELSNVIRGNLHGNRIDGAGGHDSLYGGGGNDWLIGGAGSDFLDGGIGSDTAEFSGHASDYILTWNAANGWWTITDKRAGSPNGTDALVNIEVLQFDDQAVTLEGANPNTGTADTNIGLYEYPELGMIGLPEGYNAYALSGGGTYYHVWGNSQNNWIAGNSFDNVLVGDAGNDTIDGGAGSDVMRGGDGNDTFYVDRTSDQVIETASGGTADRIYTSVSLTLATYVEQLYASGRSSLKLYGNSQNNEIVGNKGKNTIKSGSGNDKLDGGQGKDKLYGGSGNDKLDGGDGKDILYGGSGKDVFMLTDRLSKSKNLDRIEDFNVKYDKIYIDNKYFKGVGSGTESKPKKLKKSYFTIDSEAEDKNDYLIYNKKNGYLYYDKDGSGSRDAVAVAKLDKNLKLKYNDFYVI